MFRLRKFCHELYLTVFYNIFFSFCLISNLSLGDIQLLNYHQITKIWTTPLSLFDFGNPVFDVFDLQMLLTIKMLIE